MDKKIGCGKTQAWTMLQMPLKFSVGQAFFLLDISISFEKRGRIFFKKNKLSQKKKRVFFCLFSFRSSYFYYEFNYRE